MILNPHTDIVVCTIHRVPTRSKHNTLNEFLKGYPVTPHIHIYSVVILMKEHQKLCCLFQLLNGLLTISWEMTLSPYLLSKRSPSLNVPLAVLSSKRQHTQNHTSQQRHKHHLSHVYMNSHLCVYR